MNGTSSPQGPPGGGGATPRRRGIWHEDPGESRIPRPDPVAANATLLRRSASLRLRGEKTSAGPTASRRPSSYFPVIAESSEHRNADNPYEYRQPSRQHSVSTSVLSHPDCASSIRRPFTPTSSPNQRVEVDSDDGDSVASFGSVFSTMSCDHAYIARNGTTFSGRRMKYVVHCSSHAGETDEYLTPTQRATRQIRRLKSLLKQAHADIEEKNNDIFRLTKEVVELRLFNGSANVAHIDEADCRKQSAEQDQAGAPDGLEAVSPNKQSITNTNEENTIDKNSSSDLPSSLADSGHFEDLATMSVHSKDSLLMHHSPLYQHSAVLHKEVALTGSEDREGERRRIVNIYEKKLEDMQRNHVDENQEMKEKHNDKIENLLLRLSESNERFSSLRTEHDAAQERIHELERQVESLGRTVSEQEDRHQSMYLKMYTKGQEAARFEHADQVLEFAHQAPTRVSVPELLQQLQVTQNELENIKDTAYQQPDKTKTLLSAKEAISLYQLGTRKAMYRRIVETRSGKGGLDAEVTLQFLKSAVYYFFTDKENYQGHLNAIQSILGYTDNEKRNIEKGYRVHAKK